MPFHLHSLQLLRCRPCLQMPFSPQSLQLQPIRLLFGTLAMTNQTRLGTPIRPSLVLVCFVMVGIMIGFMFPAIMFPSSSSSSLHFFSIHLFFLALPQLLPVHGSVTKSCCSFCCGQAVQSSLSCVSQSVHIFESACWQPGVLDHSGPSSGSDSGSGTGTGSLAWQ